MSLARAKRKAEAYRADRQALVAAVTEGPGSLPPEVRSAIVEKLRGNHGAAVPEALRPLVELVAEHASSIGDDDVSDVSRAGFDDEAIFEAIVSAALGASLHRLDRMDELLGIMD